MTKVVLGAVVVLAALGVAWIALRPPAGDSAMGPSAEPASGAMPAGQDSAAASGPSAHGAGTTRPALPSGAAATGQAAAPPAAQNRPRVEGTEAALTARLQAVRAAGTAKARDAAIEQAWAEYLTFAGREGGEHVRAAAIDELVALYHGEDDANVRRKLLDRIDNAGTEAVLQLMFDAARSGRTDAERLSAIQNLGKFGEPGALTARMHLNPRGPDQVTAATELAAIRDRARRELEAILKIAPSESEREAIEFALKRLAMGEKR